MALIASFHPVTVDNDRVHDPVECGYRTFSTDGQHYVQFDTYGRPDRTVPGKVSQSIQLDESAAREVMRILTEAFPSLSR